MHVLIIGVGSIGERHLRNFLRIEGTTCSIAEPNAALREKTAAQYEVTRAHASWEDADFAALDGAVICAPTDLHVPIATRLVEMGVPVLSEKPIAMKLDGIAELKGAIRRTGVACGVAFVLRNDPLLGEVKQRIDGGEVGRVLTANSYAGQYWPRMRKGWPPGYARKRETGGGAIPDHLVHTINLLEWYLGPVEAVAAYQRHMDLEGIESEDYGTMTLRFGGGPVAQLTLCLFQRDAGSRLQLIGSAGTVRVVSGEKTLEFYSDKTGQWTKGRAQAVDRDDLFRLQAQQFLDCIAGKAQPRCTVEEAERTLKVVLAAIESSDDGGGFVAVT